MNFKLQLRRYGRWVFAILFLALLAAASGTYILINQRLRLPIQDRYEIKADLQAATGLSPGLGQAVNVAGVRVGQIRDVELVNGIARISMEIDPAKLPKVYDNAQAELVSNTPLKDLIIELDPGRAPGKELDDGGVIGIAQTTPPIDSDELTNALDADTRTFFDLLIADGAVGTRGRGEDFNKLLKALEPTTKQVEEISSALASRRRELKRLVGNLAILSTAAAEKDDEIASVVAAANETLSAVAGQEGALRGTLDRLPGTLDRIGSTLVDVGDFSVELKPTLDALTPAVRKLPAALRAADPLLIEAEPVLRTKVRPLVRKLQPVARDLDPATRDLNAVTPELTSAFQVLSYVANELSYNPEGSDEGFIYWLSWFAHNSSSMLSTEDAHGAVWRGIALVDCTIFTSDPATAALLDLLVGSVQACQAAGAP